jgi:hypothetical protein
MIYSIRESMARKFLLRLYKIEFDKLKKRDNNGTKSSNIFVTRGQINS